MIAKEVLAKHKDQSEDVATAYFNVVGLALLKEAVGCEHSGLSRVLNQD